MAAARERRVPPKIMPLPKIIPFLSEEQALSSLDGDDEGSKDKTRRVLKAKTLTSDRGKLHLFSSRVTLYPEPAHRAGTQLHNPLMPCDTVH